MKLEVIHAGPMVGPKGLIHMSNSYDNVKDWKIQDGQLIIEEGNNRKQIFNWTHVLRITIDFVGTVRA